jgi:hypothetical protein
LDPQFLKEKKEREKKESKKRNGEVILKLYSGTE